MSYKNDNNNLSKFFQRFKGWSIIGDIIGLVGCIKLVQGDVGLLTQSCMLFDIATLLQLCGDIYGHWKPSKTWHRIYCTRAQTALYRG